MAYFVGSTTPLAAPGVGDTWTSVTKWRERLDTVQGTVKADTNGTLHVEQSPDGTNWDLDTTTAVTGGTGTSFNVTLVAPYWRLRYQNTGAAQASFRIQGTAQAGGDS